MGTQENKKAAAIHHGKGNTEACAQCTGGLDGAGSSAGSRGSGGSQTGDSQVWGRTSRGPGAQVGGREEAMECEEGAFLELQENK